MSTQSTCGPRGYPKSCAALDRIDLAKRPAHWSFDPIANRRNKRFNRFVDRAFARTATRIKLALLFADI